jgi:hypothetical protein
MKKCTHTGQIRAVKPHTRGCEDCLKIGDLLPRGNESRASRVIPGCTHDRLYVSEYWSDSTAK